MNARVPETALLGDEGGDWSGRSQVKSSPAAWTPGNIPREAAREVFTLVFHQMRSLAGSRPELDDLVQIAAEQVVRSLGSFEGRSKMSTWTYRICYFTLLKHERWYRRWMQRIVLTERGELPEAEPSAPDDMSLESRERGACLRRAIDQLSPKRRAIVILHDLEGMSIDEAAAVVGANPRTTRSRLRDGRKDLARILAADGYFGDAACAGQETK